MTDNLPPDQPTGKVENVPEPDLDGTVFVPLTEKEVEYLSNLRARIGSDATNVANLQESILEMRARIQQAAQQMEQQAAQRHQAKQEYQAALQQKARMADGLTDDFTRIEFDPAKKVLIIRPPQK